MELSAVVYSRSDLTAHLDDEFGKRVCRCDVDVDVDVSELELV